MTTTSSAPRTEPHLESEAKRRPLPQPTAQPGQKPQRPVSRRPARPSPEVIKRRRLTVLSVAGAVILLVALVTAFWAPGFAWSERAIEVEEVLPLQPAPRVGEQTALVSAIPDRAEPLVQQGIHNFSPWQLADGAHEAWTVVFADAAIAGAVAQSEEIPGDATVVEATVGQWGTVAEAQAFLDAQLAEVNQVRQGEVEVGPRSAGTFHLTGTREAGVMWWRNGTVVIRAEGPRAALETFFTQFPL